MFLKQKKRASFPFLGYLKTSGPNLLGCLFSSCLILAASSSFESGWEVAMLAVRSQYREISETHECEELVTSEGGY
mgnify:FL=1